MFADVNRFKVKLYKLRCLRFSCVYHGEFEFWYKKSYAYGKYNNKVDHFTEMLSSKIWLLSFFKTKDIFLFENGWISCWDLASRRKERYVL